jgi:hypothetical protein
VLVLEPDSEGELLPDAVPDSDTLTLAEGVGESERLGDKEGELDGDGAPVGEAVLEVVGAAVLVALPVPLGDPLPEVEGVGEAVGAGVAEGLVEADGPGELEVLGEALSLSVGDVEEEGEPVLVLLKGRDGGRDRDEGVEGQVCTCEGVLKLRNKHPVGKAGAVMAESDAMHSKG